VTQVQRQAVAEIPLWLVYAGVAWIATPPKVATALCVLTVWVWVDPVVQEAWKRPGGGE
jgi:hypothetical protein